MIELDQGDLIRTFTDIPDNPIRPKEGDSHPLGALPIGTAICQVLRDLSGILYSVKYYVICQVLRG